VQLKEGGVRGECSAPISILTNPNLKKSFSSPLCGSPFPSTPPQLRLLGPRLHRPTHRWRRQPPSQAPPAATPLFDSRTPAPAPTTPTTSSPARYTTPTAVAGVHATDHRDRDTRAPWKLELRPSPPRPSPLRPKPFIPLLARDRPLLPSRDHKTKPNFLTAARLYPPEIAINDSGRRRRHTSAHSFQSLRLFFRERERRRDSLNSPPPCRPHRDPVRERHAITFHRRRASNRRRPPPARVSILLFFVFFSFWFVLGYFGEFETRVFGVLCEIGWFVVRSWGWFLYFSVFFFAGEGWRWRLNMKKEKDNAAETDGWRWWKLMVGIWLITVKWRMKLVWGHACTSGDGGE